MTDWWSEAQKAALQRLDIPLWVTKSELTPSNTDNAYQPTSAAKPNIDDDSSLATGGGLNESPHAQNTPPTHDAQSAESASTPQVKEQQAQTEEPITASATTDASTSANERKETDSAALDATEPSAQQLACIVFKGSDFLLILECPWGSIGLSSQEIQLVHDLLGALHQDSDAIMQQAQSFQWPPTANEMFLAEDTFLAFNEYLSDFPQKLFIMLGDQVHQSIDEQQTHWQLNEVADVQVLALPPLAEFLQRPDWKKTLWIEYLAPVANALQ